MGNGKNVRRFAEIEKNYHLFERTYSGEPYWQNIRFFVCENCFSSRYDDEGKKNHSLKIAIARWKEFFLFIPLLLRDVCFLAKPGQCDLLVIKNERLKDRFFDYWTVPDNLSAVTIRTATAREELTLKDRFIRIPLVKYKVANKLHTLFHLSKTDEAENEFLMQLETVLRQEFGKSPSWEMMAKHIESDLLRNRYYAAYYEKLLKRTRAKAMILVVYYRDNLFSQYKIAKRLGVRTIELQHGVINNHEEYYFADNSGLNNYTPDYLLTFGEIHNSWIRLPEGSRAVAVGYPYQEAVMKQLDSVITDEKMIVIYPNPNPAFDCIVNSFAETITSLGYSVVMKIHPLEVERYRELYPLLASNEKVQVITSQKEGIYYWLKAAKHHVMASTTVGLEAMAFDHTNVCIAENVPHEQTQCLIDWGVARGFSTAEELIRLVLNPMELNPEREMIRSGLWKKEGAKNVQEFLSRLRMNNWNDEPDESVEMG